MRLRHYLYYFVYLLAVVGLSLVIVLAFRSHGGENTSKTKPPVVGRQNTPSSSVQAPGSSSSTRQPSNPSSSSSSNTQTSSSSTTQLTNTGPGNMLAVFVVVSVASGLGYHYFLLKKAQA